MILVSNRYTVSVINYNLVPAGITTAKTKINLRCSGCLRSHQFSYRSDMIRMIPVQSIYTVIYSMYVTTVTQQGAAFAIKNTLGKVFLIFSIRKLA